MSQTDKKISLATAQQWTTQWRSEESTYNKHNTCNGFLVPTQDLQGVLNEMQGQTGDTFIRAYLGVDPTTNTEKLIIVGTRAEVQKDGSIIYRDLLPTQGEVGGSNSIWDFTSPCPPDCDPDSSLN
jgi:hypothetical protein